MTGRTSNKHQKQQGPFWVLFYYCFWCLLFFRPVKRFATFGWRKEGAGARASASISLALKGSSGAFALLESGLLGPFWVLFYHCFLVCVARSTSQAVRRFGWGKEGAGARASALISLALKGSSGAFALLKSGLLGPFWVLFYHCFWCLLLVRPVKRFTALAGGRRALELGLLPRYHSR